MVTLFHRGMKLQTDVNILKLCTWHAAKEMFEGTVKTTYNFALFKDLALYTLLLLSLAGNDAFIADKFVLKGRISDYAPPN